ncbi:hypothetical protein J2Z51_001369 [Enterococcus alcedinis]|nr:hypothetical protein [Enterococcus alcedinis]
MKINEKLEAFHFRIIENVLLYIGERGGVTHDF